MKQANTLPWMHGPVGARGPAALAQIRELRMAERLLHADPAELQAVANRRLASVLRAARTVEPYRTLWAGAGPVVRSAADLVELPITSRRDLQGTPLETRLTRPREGIEERMTSGSTGIPLAAARAPHESRFLAAMAWRQWRSQGIPTDVPRLTVDLERRRQRTALDVTGRNVSMSLPESPEAVADVIRMHGVEVLIAIPSVLVEVARVLGKTRMQGVVTFGEVRSAAHASELRDRFGTPPMDLYGTTEAGPISWECPSGSGYHLNADAVLVEVLDERGRPSAPDEPGDVVVTSLWNQTAPIVRYRLDDIATLLPDPCPCGITLPLMGALEGRALDWIVAPDGRRASPFRFLLVTLLGDEFGRSVRRYRVIQRTVADFLVEVVWASGRREDLVARLEPAFSWILGATVRVECRDVTEIPLKPSEKFRQVISLVEP